MHTFDAMILEGRGGGAFVEIPFDVKAEYGTSRAKVLVTFDGEPYRGTIATMGGVAMIGILKDIRAKLGKEIGATVRVTIEPDTAPREVALPDDLANALNAAGLNEAFAKLAFTHRKEHVNAVLEAKQQQTRERRIEKVIAALRAKA